MMPPAPPSSPSFREILARNLERKAREERKALLVTRGIVASGVLVFGAAMAAQFVGDMWRLGGWLGFWYSFGVVAGAWIVGLWCGAIALDRPYRPR